VISPGIQLLQKPEIVWFWSLTIVRLQARNETQETLWGLAAAIHFVRYFALLWTVNETNGTEV
jgi:hypothetical protein